MKPLLWMKPSREITPPSAVVFRTCFQLKEKQCFRLRFSADEYADLFLNGEFLTGGPCRSTTTRWHEEEYTCDLVPGEYTLTARLFLFGPKLAAHGQCSISHGFYADSELLTNPWEWQEMEHVRWETPFPDWGAPPRARVFREASIHILEGRGGNWEPVLSVPDARPLFSREIPPLQSTPVTEFRLIPRPGNSTLIVFDDYVFVRGEYRFRGNGKVTLRWTESLYRPGTFQRPSLVGDKGNRAEFEGKEWIGNGTEIELDGEPVRWFDCWRQAGRYLLLEFTGSAELEEVKFRSVGYPWQREWRAKTAEPELDRVLNLAWHTLEMCSADTFMDCPFFEQMQYISDTRLEALVALVTTRDTRLLRNALTQFADSRYPCGMIPSRTPSRVAQVIPSFALIYILMLRDLAEWRGRAEILPWIDCARGILRYFRQYRRDGLVHFPGWTKAGAPEWHDGNPGWNYLDWVATWDHGMPPGDGSLNLFYLLALEAMEFLDSSNAAEYSDSADETAAAVRSVYEVPGTGYAEDETRTVFCEHAQVLSVLSDRLPHYAPDLPGAAECSVSFSFYYLEAVRRLRRGDLFRKRLEKWFGMEKQGLRTLPENFRNPRSDCHAWSSHILYHYFASILGFRPLDAAKGHWKLDPLPIGLAFCEGEIPLGEGQFRAQLEQEGERCRLHYAAPSGIILHFRDEKTTVGRGTLEFTANFRR